MTIKYGGLLSLSWILSGMSVAVFILIIIAGSDFFYR